MQIATSKTRERFPLSRKKIIKKAITKTISCGIFLAILFVPFFAAITTAIDLSIAYIIIVFLLIVPILFLFNYFYQIWYFSVYYYELADNFITIKKGPITPKEINVPYERIQDIYMDQDLFDRILGLYDVHISSATAMSGAEAHIDGLEKNAAEGLRDLLLSIVNQKINK